MNTFYIKPGGSARKVQMNDDLDGMPRNGTEWLGDTSNASSCGRQKLRPSAIVFSDLSCARWRTMVTLSRNTPRLLSKVKGVPHATSDDHEPNDKRAPDSDSDDSSDDDDDTSNLGDLLAKQPNRLRPPRTNLGKPVVPAKRRAEPDEPLDNPSFTSSSSQSKRPTKTFSKKPSFTASNKVARQQEKPGWMHCPFLISPLV